MNIHPRLPNGIIYGFVLFLGAILVAFHPHAQTQSLSRGDHRLELLLERQEAGHWKSADPALVFNSGDQIRFRVRSNFAGYLYVMNLSTSGDYSQLFPGEQTGRMNRIEAGHEYLVPATDGWFRLEGPVGHELVYWLISPEELKRDANGQPSASPRRPSRAASLIPRCDDGMFKARGDCVDTSAGLKTVSEPDDLPADLAGIASATSRDLSFERKQNTTLVSSPNKLTGPVIFELRLAHR